ncbi:HD domain-containing protein [Marivibrio halodurans]|uniref:HD domain-containing protein n=1 Tax=Marivibrio halodurans TaxID=2039722 RepID=A0A8J7V2D9_9PROT|nr:HD domain-containing phosphohydrolase [Marivibrio halodurans]MBP5856782.1 HD domain-containing protein [Marivibrio halodurans]
MVGATLSDPDPERTGGTGSACILGPERCHLIIAGLAEQAGAHHSDIALISALHNLFRLYSEWNAEHSVRVGHHARVLAESMGHGRRDAGAVGLCACLHDIGKLHISRSILDKPGRLSADERAIVEQHPLDGLSCLDELSHGIRHIAQSVTALHHENYDGSGYPYGLSGDALPDSAQFVRVCDFFDALRADRPYRRGMSAWAAMEVLKQRKSFFRTDVLRTFEADVAPSNAVYA